MVTIKMIAKQCGYSAATVSKALNGAPDINPETASRIRQVAREMGYVPNSSARMLKTTRSYSFGVLIEDAANAGLTHEFFSHILQSFKHRAEELGYDISFVSNRLGGQYIRYTEHALYRHYDGIVVASVDYANPEVKALASVGIPMVTIDYTYPPCGSVSSDNAQGMRDLVEYVFRKGHRRIAIITGPKSVYSAKERLMGYLRALSDFGIFYDDNLVINGQMDFFTGYLACGSLLNQPDPPTAIVAANYDITIGLVTAARERGLDIPEDVDVFGFDCVEICSMLQPPLPVVHQPEERIGQIAAEYLVDRLNGYAGEPRQVVLKCSIEPE